MVENTWADLLSSLLGGIGGQDPACHICVRFEKRAFVCGPIGIHTGSEF